MEATLGVELLEEGTVGRSGRQPLRGGLEGQLDNDHGRETKHRDPAASVSADTASLRRSFAAVPLLRQLPAAAVDELWHSSRPRFTPGGATIIEQGARSDRLILLLAGRASSVASTSDGRAVLLGTWTAPAAIDKVATFSASPHPGTIVAAEPTWWCTLPREVVEDLLDRHPDARRHAMSLVAEAARQARESFIMSTRPSVSRLATWLLAAEHDPILLPRPQDQLAQRLGMTRVTLNRALHHLATAEVIALDGGKVTIQDRRRLQAIADGA